jgi:hypothetical protein
MKRLFLVALAVCGLAVAAAILSPELVAASAKTEICEGVGAVSSGGCAGGTSGLDSIIKTVIVLFSRIIGISAVLMIMYAGFKYVTAAGDSSAVGDAKKTILYAAIGLVVAAFAQAFVWFILDRATETESERKKREAAQKSTMVYPTQNYYTIEFNSKTVV